MMREQQILVTDKDKTGRGPLAHRAARARECFDAHAQPGVVITCPRCGLAKQEVMPTDAVRTHPGSGGQCSRELTGNKTQRAKGAAKQVEGNVQKGAGNVEQALDKADRKTRGTTQNAEIARVVGGSSMVEWREGDDNVLD